MKNMPRLQFPQRFCSRFPVSAVPDSARVSQEVGLHYDKTNHLLMHAMAPNVAGVIGSAVAAGILLSMLT